MKWWILSTWITAVSNQTTSIFSKSLFSPDSSSLPVTVSSSPSSGITEGGALQLACCSPAAGPQASFRWYKSTSTRPRHTGQVWHISGVTSDDSGSYYCQIQTGDRVQNSTMLPIDVECKWSFIRIWILLIWKIHSLQDRRNRHLQSHSLIYSFIHISLCSAIHVNFNKQKERKRMLTQLPEKWMKKLRHKV